MKRLTFPRIIPGRFLLPLSCLSCLLLGLLFGSFFLRAPAAYATDISCVTFFAPYVSWIHQSDSQNQYYLSTTIVEIVSTVPRTLGGPPADDTQASDDARYAGKEAQPYKTIIDRADGASDTIHLRGSGSLLYSERYLSGSIPSRQPFSVARPDPYSLDLSVNTSKLQIMVNRLIGLTNYVYTYTYDLTCRSDGFVIGSGGGPDINPPSDSAPLIFEKHLITLHFLKLSQPVGPIIH